MNTNRWVAAIVAVVAAAAAYLFFAPAAPALDGAADTGDPELAAEVRAAAGDPDGYRGLAVASIEDGRTRFAGLGDAGGGRPVGPDTPFENGSVTKAFTGMLLADMVARGEVRPTDTLADLLPDRTFDDPEVGAITLEELASHRSGLPSLAPRGLGGYADALWFQLTGADPYRGTEPGAGLDAVETIGAGPSRGQVRYSNLGMAVLGQALAERAGVPYPDLVRQRLFAPLGMDATGYPAGGEAPGAATGSRASGRPVDPWSDPAYAAAGIGSWSTAADLAAFLSAAAAGTAPGAGATEPRFTDDETSRIGYGWFTTRYGDREITWHNGGTGGFRAWVGFDPATGRGLVLLGNTDRPVDPIGIALLSGRPPAGDDRPPLFLIAVTAFLLLAAVLPLVTALTVEGGRWWPAPDRLRLVTGLASAAAGLALAYVLGPWTALPGWLWAVAFGGFGAAVAVAGRRWRALPTVRGGQRAVRVGSAALSVAISLAAVGVVAVAAAG